jgi:hypothetical protein
VAGFDQFSEWIGNEDNYSRIVVMTNLTLLAQLVSLRAKGFLAFAATLKVVVSMERS